MNILIIGGGEVGGAIAAHLVREADHNVIVVDEDQNCLNALSESLDVHTVCGRGSLPSTLAEAGAREAELLIAVTPSDEVNMVACQIGHTIYKIPKKIARVSDASFLNLAQSELYTPDHLPVDVLISPEEEVAGALFRTMFIPGAFDAHAFGANKQAMMVGAHVTENSPLLQLKIADWTRTDMPMHLLSIYRDERLIIPTNGDHLEVGDEVYFMSMVDNVSQCLYQLGIDEPPLKSACIIGGGRVGLRLALRLESLGLSVRLLEANRDRAHYLADKLNNTTILHGDALNQKLLLQEGLTDVDILVSVTSDDAANILSSVMAQQAGVKNVMTLVNQENFMTLGDKIGLEKMISPRQVSISRILQHVRPGQIIGVHTIREQQAEVLEIILSPEASLVGAHLRDLKLPEGMMLGCVIRQPDSSQHGQVVMNDGDAVLQENDHIILFTTQAAVHHIESLF